MPDRYPYKDYRFKVYSTTGIMAREFETQQLTTLINTTPPDSAAYWIIIKAIFENSSIMNKNEMLQVIDQQMQQSMQPKEAQPSMADQARMLVAQTQAKEVEISAATKADELEIKRMELALRNRELDIAEYEAENKAQQQHADGILSVAKAEAEELGSQLNMYKEFMSSLKETTKLEPGVYEDGAGKLFNVSAEGQLEDLNGETSGQTSQNSSKP